MAAVNQSHQRFGAANVNPQREFPFFCHGCRTPGWSGPWWTLIAIDLPDIIVAAMPLCKIATARFVKEAIDISSFRHFR
jgi:hypothetical protein